MLPPGGARSSDELAEAHRATLEADAQPPAPLAGRAARGRQAGSGRGGGGAAAQPGGRLPTTLTLAARACSRRRRAAARCGGGGASFDGHALRGGRVLLLSGGAARGFAGGMLKLLKATWISRTLFYYR